VQTASNAVIAGSNGMEPFQLSLNQVNFETYDLGGSGTEEPLHSFSNLVSYEWDLKSSENDGLPVKAKKIAQSKGLTSCCTDFTYPALHKNKLDIVGLRLYHLYNCRVKQRKKL